MVESLMNIDEKTKKFYSGQLNYYERIKDNIKYEPPIESFFSNFIDKLYSHQNECIKNKDENIILMGPDGSGRTTIAILIAMYKYLIHSKTTVIICDNKLQSQYYQTLLNLYLKKYNLDWLLNINSYEAIIENINKPGLYIFDIDMINRLNEEKSKEVKNLLRDTLSLIIIDNLSDFNEINLMSINKFFKSVKQSKEEYNKESKEEYNIDSTFSSIIISDYYKNIKNVVQNITGLYEWKLIQDDPEFSTGKEFRMWATQPIKYESNEKIISRKPYFDELKDLFENLTKESNEKIAVIINEGVFSQTDKENYENRWGKNVIIGKNTDDIIFTNNGFDDIKYWLFLGIKEKLNCFINSIRYIGKRDSENQIYFIYLHIPKYREFIKNPEKLFGKVEIEKLPEFKYNSVGKYNEENIWKIYEIIDSGNNKNLVSKSTDFKANILYLPDNIVIINNRRFKVEKRDIKNKEILVKKEDTFSLSIPIIKDVKITDEKEIKNEKLNSIISIKKIKANIEYNVEGYNRYEDLDVENKSTITFQNPIACKLNAVCLKISIDSEKIGIASNINIIQGFANVLWSTIESSMDTSNLHYLTIDNSMIIYTDTFFENLLNTIQQTEFFKSLLKSAFYILDACPSNEASFCDLYTLYNDNITIDKEALYKILSEFVDIDNVDARAEFKFTQNQKLNLNDTKYNKIIEAVYEEIVNLINKKLDIPTNPYSPLLMDGNMNKNYFGLYVGNSEKDGKLYINSTLNEMYYKAVIAHEYTHKWQHEQGEFDSSWTYHNREFYDGNALEIPFKGSLFVEGMATWVEIDLIAYYGITKWLMLGQQEIKQSTLMYPAGYEVFSSMVNKYGYLKAKELFKNKINKETYDKLVVEYLKTFLKAKFNEKLEESHFKCFKRDGNNNRFNMDDNMVKISYVFKGKDKKEISYQDIYKNIKDEYEKEYKEIIGHFEGLVLEKIFKDRGFNNIPCLECNSSAYNSLEDICWISDKNIKVAREIFEGILEFIDDEYHNNDPNQNKLRKLWKMPSC